MLKAIEVETARLDRETVTATAGAVNSTRQRDAVLQYILEEFGVSLEKLTKAKVLELLDNEDIPEGAKEILRLRKDASMASTAKYKAVKRSVNADGKLRGTTLFCGAQRTGRASGRSFQPQNLPSRNLLDDHEIDDGIEYTRIGAADLSPYNVMKLASSAIRRVLIPSEGHVLCISDLSNIEGRKAAWFAGDEAKLDAFTAADLGIGQDLYKLTYSKAFNVPIEGVSTKQQRDIGKVMELMLQYQGGVGAFVTGAASYNFDVEQLANDIWDTIPARVRQEAENFLDFIYEVGGSRYGLSDDAFIVTDALKRLWREANPLIPQLWEGIDNALRKVSVQKDNKLIAINDKLHIGSLS